MQKFNIFFSLLYILITVPGCTLILGETQSPSVEECKAGFIVDEIKGELSISDEAVLPETFTLWLSACMHGNPRVDTRLPSTTWAISNNKAEVDKNKIPKSNNLDNESNKAIQLVTDGNGCLHWTEEYNYAYNNKSQWIIIDRYIKGLSNGYPGVCKIPVAVNPWLQLSEHSNIQVLDYRDTYHKDHNNLKGKDRVVSEPGLSFLTKKKVEEKNNKVDIIIENLDLVFDGDNTKDNKTILQGNTVKAQLNYTIQDIHGTLRSNRINKGQFSIKPYLLISVENYADKQKRNLKTEYVIKNKNNISVNTRFENNILTSLPFDWMIPYLNITSKIALFLKVEPKGETAKRVNSFEGIYYIGPNFTALTNDNTKNMNLNSILDKKYKDKILNLSDKNTVVDTNNPSLENTEEKTSVSPSIATNYNTPDDCLKALPLDKPVESCLSSRSTEELQYLDGFSRAGWGVQKMSLRFFQVEKENWLFRKIQTVADTVITIPSQDHKVAGAYDIDIKVTDLTSGEEMKPQTVRADSEGNISFNISTKQHWYKRQRYFLKLIHLTTKNTNKLDRKKIVAINPWDYGFTHAYEVDQYDSVRTTCLNGINKNIDRKKLTKEQKIVQSLFTENIEKPSKEQMEVIYKMFCVDESQKQKNWRNTFNQFKNKLQDIFIKTEGALEQFYSQFTSSTKIKNPTMQTHLFRSINKYPTYLLDHSLKRDLFYNVRFKFTPKVVRHDSIHRGQQDKGPLRDGVYIFQMALLKNDQGRYNGADNMVQLSSDFSLFSKGNPTAGTIPLFSCPMNRKDCVTQSDFITPPTNIPVIVRDGQIRVDIPTFIQRDYHLLFANSKNLLVFRILPADPKSIVCSNEEDDCTTEQGEIYKPEAMICCQKEDGSLQDCMTFKTIQTEEKEQNCESAVICKAGDKENCSLMVSKYKKSYEFGFDWQKTIKNVQPAPVDQYDIFSYTYKTPFIPSEWTNWNITHESNTPFEALKKIYDSFSEEKDDYFPEEGSFSKEKEKDSIELTKVREATTPRVLENQSSESVKNTNSGVYVDIPNLEKENNIPSVLTTKKQNTEELFKKHISQFAEENALCTIPVHSSLSLAQKTCGSFSNKENLSQSFLNDLNLQIEVINQQTKSMYKKKNLSNDTEDVFPAYQSNALSFKTKLENTPQLPLLNQSTISKVIQKGINHKSLTQDKDTMAFAHALCGFWFGDFLSKKYINGELLEDGWKKEIKKSFHYQMRGILDDEVTREIPEEQLSTLREHYNKHLKELNKKGEIFSQWNQWVDKTEGVVKDQKSKFEDLAKQNPFKERTKEFASKEKYFGQILKSSTDGFTDQSLFTNHPYRKCIHNPSHFFGFEKKNIVQEIDAQSRYGSKEEKGGELLTLTVSEDFLMNTQNDQGANQQLEMNLQTTASLVPLSLLGIAGLATAVGGPAVVPISAFAALALSPLMGGLGYSYRSYTGTGNRRLISLRFNQGVELIAERTPMTIKLKKYHECLVVRPRQSAFGTVEQKGGKIWNDQYRHIWNKNTSDLRPLYEKVGILVCAEGDKLKDIKEDYYYIYPKYAINAITTDPSSHRNKPFALSLRGKTEYKRFIQGLNCDVTKDKDNRAECRSIKRPFEYLFNKNIEFAQNLRAGFEMPKMFHLTSDSPGVHSEVDEKAYNEKDLSREIEKKPDLRYKILNFMNSQHYMYLDLEQFIREYPEE